MPIVYVGIHCEPMSVERRRNRITIYVRICTTRRLLHSNTRALRWPLETPVPASCIAHTGHASVVFRMTDSLVD